MGKVTDSQLLEAVLADPGATDAELGLKLGLSRVQIARRRNDGKFKELFNDRVAEALAPLLAARVKAVRLLCKSLDSENDRVALKASEIILDRAPPLPARKEDRLGSSKEIIELMQRMKDQDERRRQREYNFEHHRLQMTDKEMADMHESMAQARVRAKAKEANETGEIKAP